jgi:prepilin-type N-terminal cleavage/methylation domain-containing protein
MKIKNNRGLTLIEIMIALSVLGISFAITYGFFIRGLKVYHRHQKEMLLQSQLEKIMDSLRADIFFSPQLIFVSQDRLILLDKNFERITYKREGRVLKRNQKNLSSYLQELHFNFYGSDKRLDLNNDGVISVYEIDLNDDERITGSELEYISLVEVIVTVSDGKKKLEVANSFFRRR